MAALVSRFNLLFCVIRTESTQNEQQKMTNINRPTNLFCTANIVKKLLMMTNILTLKPLN